MGETYEHTVIDALEANRFWAEAEDPGSTRLGHGIRPQSPAEPSLANDTNTLVPSVSTPVICRPAASISPAG